MTENEDIEKILYMGVGRSGIDNENSKIAKALNELMQYRAIGTVKEIKIREAQFERLSAGYLNDLSLLREYQAIGTVEDLKTMKENGAFTGVELASLACMQLKLKKLKDAEEQGLLLRLTCKVGDKVWCLTSANTKIVECKVLWIEKHSNGVLVFALEGGLGDVVLAHLNKTWFLTKEEADQALKQMGE